MHMVTSQPDISGSLKQEKTQTLDIHPLVYYRKKTGKLYVLVFGYIHWCLQFQLYELRYALQLFVNIKNIQPQQLYISKTKVYFP